MGAPQPGRVSVIIPTMGSSKQVGRERRIVLLDAIDSVIAEVADIDLEVVVVYDPPTPAAVLAELRAKCGERLLLVPFEEPFNFSRKINVGAVASSGELLVLLNDDVKARRPGWLADLLAPLADPGVGLTGAKLYYEDGTIQHIGHAYTERVYWHPMMHRPGADEGEGRVAVVSRDVSGVTGACVAVRRDTFESVGGLTELMPNNYNDVDFSYKIRARGLRIVFVATAELFHFESVSRDPMPKAGEYRAMYRRWGVPDTDPYWPGLTRQSGV